MALSSGAVDAGRGLCLRVYWYSFGHYLGGITCHSSISLSHISNTTRAPGLCQQSSTSLTLCSLCTQRSLSQLTKHQHSFLFVTLVCPSFLVTVHEMIRSLLSTLTFLFLLVSQVRALSAILGSPCYDTCNGSSAATSSDIVCTDNSFANTTKGQLLENCLTCLHGSSYKSGSLTDSILFLCK